jgi:hypothetical protein
MPISEPEWNSIRSLTEKVAAEISGTRMDYFITGTVIKNDPKKKLIWLREFADQPVPVVGFDYQVKYYNITQSGQTVVRKETISPSVPKVGQVVLVARELGVSRLPRCLGVIQGKGWISGEED